ncbi:MAG: hypothetical protein IH597_12815 [Bacteroidales bacterium]|nr:hypothetical protein [Bacteroidales bacterium]
MKKYCFSYFPLIFFVLIIIVSGCYYDNEEYLYGDPGTGVVGCDTLNVTYSGTIAPILSTHCIGCHNQNIPNAGVILNNYNGLKTQIDNGRFWGAINHQNGFAIMPPSGIKLSNCNLLKIQKWIDDGALNN